jgi:hypothetical protein
VPRIPCDGRELAHQHAHDGIVRELIVIDEVLIAERDADDALADQRAHRMLNQRRHPSITQAGRETTDEPDRPVCLPEQQRTGIRRDRAAAEVI